jgi:membrane protease YdiL (CAAX protease family)
VSSTPVVIPSNDHCHTFLQCDLSLRHNLRAERWYFVDDELLIPRSEFLAVIVQMDSDRHLQTDRPEPRCRCASRNRRLATEDHLRSWLDAHPVAGFVLLAYGISYLVGGPALLVGLSAIPVGAGLLHTYVPRVLVVYGPGLAALTLAHLSRHDDGAFGLLRLLVPSWTEVAWAAGILISGAAAGAAALIVAGAEPTELRRIVLAHAGLLLAHFTLQVGIVATGEELGWRGWLLPRLVERTNRLQATLLTAGLWASALRKLRTSARASAQA